MWMALVSVTLHHETYLYNIDPLNPAFIYSWTLLSRLFRITAYLEVKIWSLF